jgi:hypothetical protein
MAFVQYIGAELLPHSVSVTAGNVSQTVAVLDRDALRTLSDEIVAAVLEAEPTSWRAVPSDAEGNPIV